MRCLPLWNIEYNLLISNEKNFNAQAIPIIRASHSAWNVGSTDMSKAWTAGLVLSATHSTPNGALRASCNRHLQVIPSKPSERWGSGSRLSWTKGLGTLSSDAAKPLINPSLWPIIHVLIDETAGRSFASAPPRMQMPPRTPKKSPAIA